jgi:hypothetical protein
MDMKKWKSLKKKGNEKYKTLSVEPIDLGLALGIFRHFALHSIIKYACRNASGTLSTSDMKKIIHYAELLIAAEEPVHAHAVTAGEEE